MTFPLCTTSCPNMNVNSLQLHSMAINGNQVRFKLCSSMRVASTVPLTSENSTIFLRERERVKELALRQQALLGQHKRERHPLNLTIAQFHGLPRSDLLAAAYDRCRELFLRERDPFGWAATSLMKPEKQKALWAIWAWGRRLDELVDGVNGSHATHDTLDRWKERTVDTYQGRPWDIYDVALFDTVSNFPIDIQLFHDLTEGTRLDMMNKRFANFDELYLYENYVNGTIFLLFFQMMGIDPESKSSLESVYHATSIFAAGFGLIDMLRDVGEDARLGRIFLPEDELLLAGIPDDDIFNGKVTDKWRAFMKGQIKRARGFLDEGKHVINELEVDVRWAIWTGLLLYMQLLDGIEANDYDNLTKKASLGKGKMLLTTLIGYGKSRGLF